MAVRDILGYVLAGLGLLGIVASSTKIKTIIPLLNSLPANYLLIASGVLVAAGIIVLVINGNKVKQAAEEVPIYEGEGRNRKIVGYQRVK